MGPRQPRRGDLALRQAAQQVGVGFGSGHRGERRSGPRAADDGDVFVARALRLADRLAHPRLALQVGGLGGLCFAQGGDEVDDGAEDLRALVAALELFLPPEFAVGIAGGLSGGGERVAAQATGAFVARRVFFFVFLFVEREPVALRQVHETHRHVVRQRPTQRLPLGRKLRERVERRALRFVGSVDEQRDRRAHLRVRGERDQRVGIRRPLDEQRLRSDGFQRRQHPPRRPRPMMTNAEDVRSTDHVATSSTRS